VAKAFEDAAAGIKKAGDEGERTSESVQRIVVAADNAAEASQNLGDNLEGAANQARSVSFTLQGVSDRYIELLLLESQRSFDGFGGGKVAEDLARQNEQLDRLINSTRAQNAQYDETERRVRRLRNQYELLSEDRIRQLAQEQVALERNRENINEEPRPDSSRPPPTPSPGQPSSFTGPLVNITVNGSLIGTSPQRLAEELARLIGPELRRLRERGLPV